MRGQLRHRLASWSNKLCKRTIKINKNASDAMQMQSLFHEMLHGMLIQIGRNEESADECFVQSLSNAMDQRFRIKGDSE